MTHERYKEVSEAGYITDEEWERGWHFCCEWDGLLVGPGMEELKFCNCFIPEHPVYKTTPSTLAGDPGVDANAL